MTESVLACPECTDGRTFGTMNALGAHRHLAHGVTREKKDEGKPRFEQNPEGRYKCSEAGCTETFQYPYQVGKHRWFSHGIPGNWRRKKPKAQRAPKHKPSKALVPTDTSQANDLSPEALYLFAGIEEKIKAYANDNGIAAKPLFGQVAVLLLGVAQR